MSEPDTGELSRAIADTAHAYDEVPYTSIPFQRLQPARLAAIARLMGLPAPEAATARVLEIGCATGGHLVPLAAQSPHARFVGIDISEAQIADGVARGARLGLKNLDMHAVSLDAIDATWGEFDYILAHGVYSWVPDAIRAAILRVCAERLAPEGIALVSFNVFPGWRIFQAVRDSMHLHAGGIRDQPTRMRMARELFALMHKHASPKSSYGSIWRNEAARMMESPDYYLTHEVFENDNQPSTYADFCAAAARNGLGYLAESRLRTNFPEFSDTEHAPLILHFAAQGVAPMEQYLDIVTGRTFREALLVHAPRLAQADRRLDAARFASLQVISPLDLRIRTPSDGSPAVIETDAEEASIDDAGVAAALRRIVEAAPQSIGMQEIAPPDMEAGARDRLMQAVKALFLQGMIEFSTEPVRCAVKAGAMPLAYALLASDAAAGMPGSATLRHAPITIDPQMRFVLAHLDGATPVAHISEAFAKLVISGEVSLTNAEGRVSDPELIRARCAANVEREIEKLASVGGLAAGT